MGAQGKYIKWGPYCVREAGGTPPENFEILHALKCVLGASQVLFCAYIQQWQRKTFEIGGSNDSCAHVSTHMVGGSGGMLPKKNFAN